jgi:5-enolpyruvylshikimate-3-phosphate synthase
MADSKHLNDVSPNSDTRLTNLLAIEHKKLEDGMKKLDEEIQRQQDQVLKVAEKWYLSHLREDGHQKVDREREINIDYMSVVPPLLLMVRDAKLVDNIQSIKISFDNRIKSITEDIKKMKHAVEKLTCLIFYHMN